MMTAATTHALTIPQREILFHQLRVPGSPLYNIGGYVEFDQPVDLARMAAAFARTLAANPQLCRAVRFADPAPEMADAPGGQVPEALPFVSIDVSAA